jgi:predicted metal-binding protein
MPFDWEYLPETCNECEHCHWIDEYWKCMHPEMVENEEHSAILDQDWYAIIPHPRWCPLN